MSELYLSKGLFPADFLRPSVEFILAAQLPDGCIPWFPGAHADPWDHVEAAMGLVVAGEHAAARRAYEWLCRAQLPDGSWWIAYKDGEVHDRSRRETNFVAYVATGLWHYQLATG
ncbi:MAG: prenyltransferase, partial [Gammaproteobacteria bacterium]